ncbi:helix-turn-helix transcriptional regulator [Streptomyces sp. NPDC005393]|uniref:PadR family transcriptional regulator n=1 Tax=Streptomyces sp. NPDC005393 TaxID=3157041 RepID=UPI0033A36A96
MSPPFKITSATLDVLEALLGGGGEMHGFAVAKAAARPTGSVYPILARLEQAGWLESDWEAENPEAGRPRRRFYRLTGDGASSARSLLLERRGRVNQETGPRQARPLLGFVRNWVSAQ